MKEGVDVLIFTDCSNKYYARGAGAYRIATEIRKHGYTVQVVDHFILAGLDRILLSLEKFVGSKTLMIGFSTTFMNIYDWHKEYLSEDSFLPKQYTETTVSNMPSVTPHGLPMSDSYLKIIRQKVHSINPKTKLVIGGANAHLKAHEDIDTYIVGYADTTVIEYLKYLDGKNPFFQFKRDNGRIIIDHDVNASSFEFQNSVINYEDSDLIEPNEALPIEIARGCIFNCKYCSYRLKGKKKLDYLKDSDALYSEFMRNYEKFGVTRYIYSDDTHNDTVYKLEQLAKVYQRLPFKIEFACYLRLELLHRYPEMADLLKDGGLKSAKFGIETLNYKAGKIVGKGFPPEKIKETLTWLREDKKWGGNILMSSGFIIGLPTETEESVRKWASELLDFNYPLDSVIFLPLWIAPFTTRPSKSDFDVNYQKYGYYFDNKKSKGWVSKDWCFEDAAKLSSEFANYAFENGRIKMPGFNAIVMPNYGYTWEQLLNQPAKVINEGVGKKTKEMSDNYFRKLLNDS